MARPRKKRNKPYRGQDAKVSSPQTPVIHHYEAAQRSPLMQWWHERRRGLRITGLIGGGVLLLGWLVFELLRIIF